MTGGNDLKTGVVTIHSPFYFLSLACNLGILITLTPTLFAFLHTSTIKGPLLQHYYNTAITKTQPLLPPQLLHSLQPPLQYITMEKGTATQTASSTGRTASHPTYMTEAELASYHASWEQLDIMTAQRLKAARGMDKSYRSSLAL